MRYCRAKTLLLTVVCLMGVWGMSPEELAAEPDSLTGSPVSAGTVVLAESSSTEREHSHANADLQQNTGFVNGRYVIPGLIFVLCLGVLLFVLFTSKAKSSQLGPPSER
jgi:hypothetical protein